MTSSDLLAPHLDWFDAYSRAFLQGPPADLARVQLKRDHTLRVLDFARQITASLPLDAAASHLIHLAALFHDLGRFPQYAQHRTFNDRQAGNHAYLSVRVLRGTGILEQFPAASRRLILTAIALHNRRFLPPHLPPDIDRACRVVRDADKLDIFSIMLAYFAPGAPHDDVVHLGLQPHPTRYTPAILEQVRSCRLADYAQMVWVNDFKLLLLSWLYDLNFTASFQIMHRHGYLIRLLAYLPASPEFTALGNQLQADLKHRSSSPPSVNP